MAKFNAQVNFTAELDGTTVNEINKKLDYSKNKLDDRKKIVEDILNGTDFFIEYFSEYFNPNINNVDYLSSNINVCRSLERMANYLLNSKEIKQQEDAEKTQYVFYTDEKYFQKKLNKEKSIESITQDHKDNVIHFLKRNEPNYKKEKKQTINLTRNDKVRFKNKAVKKNEQELKRILNDYQQFHDFLTEKLVDKNKLANRYLLSKTKSQVEQDMIYTKDSFLRIFGYNLQNFHESTVPTLDVFDFTNPLHVKGGKVTFVDNAGNEHEVYVKGLLYFKNDFDPNDEFSFVIADFNKTVDQAGLTNDEKFVLNSIRNGLTQEEIAAELGTYQKKISRMIDIIANKVMRVGNKYDLAEE